MGMKPTQAVLDAIARAEAEGRVTEAFGPGLPLAEDISEKDFQAAVVAEAKRNGWLVFHVYYSQKSNPGFPDLWLAKDRIIHVELKTETGKLTPEQLRFRDAILAAKGEWYLWRPGMWKEIVNVLKGVD